MPKNSERMENSLAQGFEQVPGPAFWHVTCSQIFRNERMAAKMKLMKMLQEIRGLSEITSRRPHPRFPGLFMIQLRSHVVQTTWPRRKLVIPIEMLNRPDIPSAVEIKHLPFVAPIPAPAAESETVGAGA